MATFFIIEENTKGRAQLLFNGQPIVIGQKYPILQQNLFTITSFGIFIGVPLDEFKFSIEKDGVRSQNISKAVINSYVNGIVPEIVVDPNIDAPTGTIFNVSDFIPFEESFDRINVKNVKGKGRFVLENDVLQTGQYMYYDIFDKLKFVSELTNQPENYGQITYSHATDVIDFNDDTTLTFNIIPLSFITSELLIETEVTDDYTLKKFRLSAEDLPSNASYRLNIDIDSDYTLNAGNSLTIENIEQSNTFDSTTENFNYEDKIGINETRKDVYFTLKMYNPIPPGSKVTIELTFVPFATIDPDRKILIFNL